MAPRGYYPGSITVPGATTGQILVAVNDEGDFEPSSASAVTGHWEPVTNGDPDTPELLFSDGDVLMSFVED